MELENRADKVPAGVKTGWWSFDLPGYRPHPSDFATYSLFSYEALPPFDIELDDDFLWLLAQPEPSEGTFEGLDVEIFNDPEAVDDEEFEEWDDEDREDDIPDKLAAIEEQVHMELPRAFMTYLSLGGLENRLRSCTACYFQLFEKVVKVKGAYPGYLIHFLSDQQWCLHWYLYVGLSGQHFVVVTPYAYGHVFDPAELGEDEEPLPDEVDLTDEDEPIWFCAPSFKEFIYRYWMENEIWFNACSDTAALTAAQLAYLQHYEDIRSGG